MRSTPTEPRTRLTEVAELLTHAILRLLGGRASKERQDDSTPRNRSNGALGKRAIWPSARNSRRTPNLSSMH